MPDPRSLAYGAARVVVRDLPPRRRGMRLANGVHRFLPPTDALLDGELWCGCRVRVDLRDSIQSSIYYKGTYEPTTTSILRAELHPGDVMVDVGANVGYYTFIGACLVGPGGHVHAVEPSPTLLPRLRADVARNGLSDAVSVHGVAVSDYEGSGFLGRGQHDPTPDGDAYLSRAPSGRTSESEVPVTTLDAILADERRVDVVKLDVEGQEVAALQGMAAVLERCRPRLLLVEVDAGTLGRSDEDPLSVFELLSDAGYEGTRYHSPHHAPMAAFRPA